MAIFFITLFLDSYSKNPDAQENNEFLNYTGGFICRQSISQSFSALSAPSFQYFSSISGSHSFSETVFFFSMALFRLVSS